MNEVVALGYLILCSRWDYKWKYIPVWVLAVGTAVGLALFVGRALWLGEWNWSNALVGLLPGMCVSVLSFLSADQIGLGDGIVLLVIGWMLGFRMTILSAILGLFVATIFGVGMVILKKGSLQTAVPFIPFLAVGLGISIIIA